MDRRVKLSPQDKIDILELYQSKTQTSKSALAREFKVSRRTIDFIIDPQLLVANRKKFEERGGWKQYYDTEAHRVATNEMRAYKRTQQ